MTDPFDDYADLVEAAAILRIHSSSLRRLVRDGHGPPARLYAGKYLFERGALQQFKSGYSPQPGRKSWGRGRLL